MRTTRETPFGGRRFREVAGPRPAHRHRGHGEEGATLAEYGLLMVLIVVVCVAAVTLFGSTISVQFSNLAGGI